MKSKRNAGSTNLLVASIAVAFGLATACGGGDDSGSGTSDGATAGMSGAGASSEAGSGASGKAGSGGKAGSDGKAGSGGEPGSSGNASTVGNGGSSAGRAGSSAGGSAGQAGNLGTVGGDEGLGGQGALGGSSSENAGAGGEAEPVDPNLVSLPYSAATFPPENPDSPAKDMLGKILFWDEQVGSDNTMACGTCHRTGSGGSDPRAVNSTSAFRNPGDDAMFGTADDIHGSQGIKYCTGGDGAAVTYAAVPSNNTEGLNPLFGTNHQVTSRKAPTYLDAFVAANIFWDGRATSAFKDPTMDPSDPNSVKIQAGGALESQSVGPPMNPGEMACDGRTWTSLINKLKDTAHTVPLALAKNIPPDMVAAIANAPNYPALFALAFPNDPSPVNPVNFAFAIATHERHLQSNQTPWDRFNQYLIDPSTGDRNALNPAQIRGLTLFEGKAKCSACHTPPLFTDSQFHNLGFIAENDPGRQKIVASAAPHSVKTANLRNVGLRETQGLFHYGYGPGSSLENLVATYNNPPNIGDPAADDGSLAGVITNLNLTADEQSDLIDFLRNGLTDPRVKNEVAPFDRPKLSTE
ncbi:MAG TPA: cytochrome c peroxidase [Polyangiaceae bacterium]|nr:cytochrome c peroxidase [Polyangiaceae bacterium]